MSDAQALKIRDAVADDRPAIRELVAQLSLYETTYAEDRTARPEHAEEYLTALEGRIAARGGAILLAESETNGDGAHAERIVLGYSAYVIASDHEYIVERYRRHIYITDMFVRENARKIGVGRALISEIRGRATDLGIVRIGIGALARNAHALEAYARLGFASYAIEHVLDLDRI